MQIANVTSVPVLGEQLTKITNIRSNCLYHHFMIGGLPPLTTMSLLKGSNIKAKTKTWLEENWYNNTGIMSTLADFIINVPQNEKVFHPAYDRTHASAVEGILEFIVGNLETLAHLSSGFDFKKGYNPFIPRVSEEVIGMSFLERQKLLTQNREQRLTEAKNKA